MRRFFHMLRLFLAAVLVTACTPSRTGVIGNTLTTNTKPVISITGQAPLVVRAHGRLNPESGPTPGTGTASLFFDYAFFMPTDTARCFAYAAIVRITGDTFWRFQPPTAFPGTFSEAQVHLGGFAWSEQFLRVSETNDWGCALYRENGGTAAEFWLAKRWVAHLNDATRAVMEYREPWPEDLRLIQGTLIMSDSAAEALTAFSARADAAFMVERKAGDFSGQDKARPGKGTAAVPDIPKLVGEVLDSHEG